MAIIQLFHGPLNDEDLKTVLSWYGLLPWSLENHNLNRAELQLRDVVKKINENMPLLESIYLPNKAEVYLKRDMDVTRAITILRHVLRSVGYSLIPNFRKKIPHYHILRTDKLSQRYKISVAKGKFYLVF